MENSQKVDITAEGVVKSFGAFHALKGLDLNVEEGEFLTIFGPNGSGKTTLIKLLSTLTKPTSGRIVVAGHDVAKEPDNARASVGVISHDPFLYENLTAHENIEFYASLYGLSNTAQRASLIISRVGLESRAGDRVSAFSRGMKQRLAMARALVHEPGILLLDEPYTGLDQQGISLLRDTLLWMKSLGRTIIMTTHNISEGLEISDSAAILNGGKIAYRGDARGVQVSEFKQVYLRTTKAALDDS